MNLNSFQIPPVHRFIISVDVDGWASLLRFYSVDHDPDEVKRQVGVEEGIEKLLTLFEQHEIKATFFVAGEVAQTYPKEIRKIAQNNHEVGCHGLYHERSECLLNKEEQRSRIEKARNILENCSGLEPSGFRAPCLRANSATLEVLSEMGFVYDSSFLPMAIPGQYGSFSFKFKPYYPLSKNTLLEIPVSANPIFPLPLSASWMRNLGLSWVKFGVKTLFALGWPVMFYIHPRDVVSLPFIRGVPRHVYRKTGDYCLERLDALLKFVKRHGGQISRAIDLALDIKSKKLSMRMMR